MIQPKAPSILKKASVLCIIVLLSGCAIGNHYDYSSVRTTLSQTSKKNTVAVATVDVRADLLNSSVPSNYVGMTRGGFGNPFRVHTKSGAPLAEDVSKAVTSSLQASGRQSVEVVGFPVTDLNSAKTRLLLTPADRHVLITINKWESDTLINTDLTTDVTVQVFDRNGKLLTEEQFAESKGLGGSLLNPIIHARESILAETSLIFSKIFSSSKIGGAL